MKPAFVALASSVIGLSLPACAPRSPPQQSVRAPDTKAAACGRSAVSSCRGAPSYALEVRPILESRCFLCHAGDGVAAEEHDFSRFETLHTQRAALADDVAACAMPPSTAPPLDDRQADVLARWVACGGLDR